MEDGFNGASRRGLLLLCEAQNGMQEFEIEYDTRTCYDHISLAQANELGCIVNASTGSKA